MEGFAPFGSYAQMINPSATKFGAPPIEFFRDMVQLELGQGAPSFSVCRVEPRPLLIDITEYHSHTGEGILPLDADVLLHFATATGNGVVPEAFRVFRVPCGTFVAIRPGVWHHAPFALAERAANVLIVLPERTYANDCVVLRLEKPLEITPPR